MTDYEKELDFVKEADDNLFPDFLYNPLFNDFGDNYYQNSFANDELITKVKKLRRRYSDYFDWLEAMDTYNEYMDILIDKYGSERTIKNAAKADLLMDPYPAKPKLKNTRKNRQFQRAGSVPSKKLDVQTASGEEMIAIARQLFPNANGDTVDESDSDKKLPKKLQKKLKRIEDTLAGKDRKRNMYRSVSASSGTDFIVEYLNQAKRGVYNSHGQKNEYSDKSLYEMMKEDERTKYIRPEILDDMNESNTTQIVNGRLVNRQEYQKMEIYKELAMGGIDVIGNFGKGMTRKAQKMIRSQIGESEPLTKKQMKKIKKRSKEERERMERRRDSNRLLEQTLLGNKINKFDFDSDDKSISFRLKDIYRD